LRVGFLKAGFLVVSFRKREKQQGGGKREAGEEVRQAFFGE